MALTTHNKSNPNKIEKERKILKAGTFVHTDDDNTKARRNSFSQPKIVLATQRQKIGVKYYDFNLATTRRKKKGRDFFFYSFNGIAFVGHKQYDTFEARAMRQTGIAKPSISTR